MSIRLPRIVALPTKPALTAAELSAVFDGASRQRIMAWRSRHGFPRSDRAANTSYTATANVAAWLDEQGIKVQWI
jgi:hypothetical protein